MATTKPSNTPFDDHDFNSASYASFRPDYPPSLFAHILKFHRSHPEAATDTALDVACGTGQASLGLTESFKSVIGTDISEAMLASAAKHPKISYHLSRAERFPDVIAPGSIDLITVAEAAHWLDMPQFYANCAAALKPSGTVAIWGYSYFTVDGHPELTQLHQEYAHGLLGPYWDKRRYLLDAHYSDPSFSTTPFSVFQRETFPSDSSDIAMTKTWSITGIANYLRTWSAYKTYKEQNPDAEDPVDILCRKFMDVLGTNSMETQVKLTWPLILLTMKW
eukprot:jgi/Hompol1/5848/HPOL_004737-RA